MNIYMITNLINGKSYIGKDQNDNQYYMGSGLLLWNSYRKRFNNSELNGYKRSDHKWVYFENKKQNIYNKTILCHCNDSKELCELEKYYIDLYNTIRPNGYNIAEGGEGGNLVKGYSQAERERLNKKISDATKEAMNSDIVREKFLAAVCNKGEEWRRHISESLTGRKGHPMSEDQKKILGERNAGNQYGIGNKSRTGQHNSLETNRKISEAQKKIIHTKEWNKKVSESLKGKPKSDLHKQALKKPKPKYKWLLPDGTIRIMDASNGSRHQNWIKLELVS